jgi:hypothetical protein
MRLFGTHELNAFSGPDDQLADLIDWKAGDIGVLRHYYNPMIGGAKSMTQRMFTVELRVDFADVDKLGPMKKALQQCARHAFATAQLISDNPKSTRIVVYSDDFFSGHEDIALLDDDIQKGLDDAGGKDDGGTIDASLMAAVTGNGS